MKPYAMIHHRKHLSERGPKIRRLFALALTCFVLLVSGPSILAQVHLLVDHVGYEATATKKAFVGVDENASLQDAPDHFALIDTATSKVVFTGTLKRVGRVDRWGNRLFLMADFSAWQKTGEYRLEATTVAGQVATCTFAIKRNVLERETLSNVIFYLKGQRASGDIDKADRQLALPDGSGYVDLRGGWYDATGDYGIHLSH